MRRVLVVLGAVCLVAPPAVASPGKCADEQAARRAAAVQVRHAETLVKQRGIVEEKAWQVERVALAAKQADEAQRLVVVARLARLDAKRHGGGWQVRHDALAARVAYYDAAIAVLEAEIPVLDQVVQTDHASTVEAGAARDAAVGDLVAAKQALAECDGSV